MNKTSMLDIKNVKRLTNALKIKLNRQDEKINYKSSLNVVAMARPERVNQHWYVDIGSSGLRYGCQFQLLTVLDKTTHMVLALEIDHSFNAQQVTKILDRISLIHGLPKVVFADKRPEFTCKEFILWVNENNIEVRLIQFGNPASKAVVERFNG